MGKEAKPVSNWSKLKGKVAKASKPAAKPEAVVEEEKAPAPTRLSAKAKEIYVGLDCEMVGIGPEGKQSALARCCLVGFDGGVLYDEYVRPPGFVTDFRTKYSGIRKSDLRQGTAITLQECQRAVAALLRDKVLVGHALRNDLDVLMLSHPRTHIRDTACYRPYMRVHGLHGKLRPRALRDLTKQHLGLVIQAGEHDPAEDARCAMRLYALQRDAWEQQLRDLKQAARSKAEEQQTLSKGQKLAQKKAQREMMEARKKSASSRARDALGGAGDAEAGSGDDEEDDGSRTSEVAGAGAAASVRVIKSIVVRGKGSVGAGPVQRKDGTYVNGGLPLPASAAARVEALLDIEVQVQGEEDGEDGEEEGEWEKREEEEEENDRGKKKRKLSRAGNINSASRKNVRVVDAKLSSAKAGGEAKTEADRKRGEEGGDRGVKGGRGGGGVSGMFSSSITASLGLSAGKAMSVGDVDRLMQQARKLEKRR